MNLWIMIRVLAVLPMKMNQFCIMRWWCCWPVHTTEVDPFCGTSTCFDSKTKSPWSTYEVDMEYWSTLIWGYSCIFPPNLSNREAFKPNWPLHGSIFLETEVSTCLGWNQVIAHAFHIKAAGESDFRSFPTEPHETIGGVEPRIHQ